MGKGTQIPERVSSHLRGIARRLGQLPELCFLQHWYFHSREKLCSHHKLSLVSWGWRQAWEVGRGGGRGKRRGL